MDPYFSNSRIITAFDTPLTAEEIKILLHPLLLSQEDLTLLSENWMEQLNEKKRQLAIQGTGSVIKKYEPGHTDDVALYVNDKPVMWPGACITLLQSSFLDSKLHLIVSKISYPFISALSNEEFRRKMSGSPLLHLRPPLAICTFAITSDYYVVLTVRGQHTNVYPGRFYGQGGNPSSAHVDLIDHQVEEMKDELFANENDIDMTSFRFLGLVEDAELFPRKPDLIGLVNLKVDKDTVKANFYKRDKKERPADAAELRFLSLNERPLFSFLKKEFREQDFCPPAFSGLYLVGKNLV